MLLPSVGADGARVEDPVGLDPVADREKDVELAVLLHVIVLSAGAGYRALPATGTGAAARYITGPGLGPDRAGAGQRVATRHHGCISAGRAATYVIGGNAVGGTHDLEAAMTTNRRTTRRIRSSGRGNRRLNEVLEGAGSADPARRPPDFSGRRLIDPVSETTRWHPGPSPGSRRRATRCPRASGSAVARRGRSSPPGRRAGMGWAGCRPRGTSCRPRPGTAAPQ